MSSTPKTLRIYCQGKAVAKATDAKLRIVSDSSISTELFPSQTKIGIINMQLVLVIHILRAREMLITCFVVDS